MRRRSKRAVRARHAGAAICIAALVAACGVDDGAGVRGPDPGEGAVPTSTTARIVGGSVPMTGVDARRGDAATGAAGSGSGSASGAAVQCQAVGDSSVADSQLDVTLGDAFVSAPGPAVSGKVNLVATNVGSAPHEVVVVVGDDVAALPTDAEGAFDEEAYGVDRVLGEIEAFPAGEDCNGVFDLAPGPYVLLCNLTEVAADGTVERHFARGMATVIEVDP